MNVAVASLTSDVFFSLAPGVSLETGGGQVVVVAVLMCCRMEATPEPGAR